MRHDWNSLLGNEACAPVTNRTTARFPRAEVLVEYLREFAQPQEAAGRIEYGAEVQRIKRWAKDEEGNTLDWSRMRPLDEIWVQFQQHGIDQETFQPKEPQPEPASPLSQRAYQTHLSFHQSDPSRFSL